MEGKKRKFIIGKNRYIISIFLLIIVIIYVIFKFDKTNNNIFELDVKPIDDNEDIKKNNKEFDYKDKEIDLDISIKESELEEKNTDLIEEDKLIESNGNKLRSYYIPLQEDINADDAKVVESMLKDWNYKRDDGKKVAYLTFDDGPSQYVTKEILDILNKNNVKATFFILGKMIEINENSKDVLIRIAEEGHAIGNHTFTHRYDILYPNKKVNINTFIEEINRTEKALKDVLGEDFETRIIRFPGGKMSWETKDIDKELNSRGYVSIDWNTLNGDAEGSVASAEVLISRLKETIEYLDDNGDTLIILMHDSDQKETTVQYLQSAIDYLKSLGYEFRTLK